VLEHSRAKLFGHVVLFRHAAPRDVARIARLEVGHELLANGGIDAVRSDQQIALDARPIREDGRDFARVRLEPLELHSGVVKFRGKRVPKRVIDAIPSGGDLAHRNFANDVAAGT